ncbi:uncharacterized protein LOC143365956 [Andrena cerasifolii]|uniref:uncharacterized protein LOC143365956 n=1 Tax=Andrena cerasifolii TaxID=2819439 RepID=UPI0040382476
MWKTFCPLLLMLSTFDFPRDKSAARAEPAPAAVELVIRGDDLSHREETRGRTGNRDEISDGGVPEDQETSSELVGRWRNNDGALEPKWRDGDTVPLLPFSQFSEYTKDKIDNDDEDDYGRRGTKYRENNGPDEPPRSRSSPRISYPEYTDYELAGDKRGREEYEEVSPRKKDTRPASNRNAASSKGTSKETLDFAENKDATSSRYREAFQLKDYEHELGDGEYLKPRPRKRRPPQNYEFALAKNETSSNERKLESNSGPWPRTNVKKNPSESDARNDRFVRNSVELKSLLKMQQEEGLSLSELLQRRNLTLNDLLRGKADVINALKSKDNEEAEDYIEEASKIMSHTFTRVSVAKKPPWITDLELRNTKSSQIKDEHTILIIPVDGMNLTNSAGPGSSLTKRVGIVHSGAENATMGGSMIVPDPPRAKVTPTTSSPTMIATSSSMELLPSNDSAGKSPNGGETRGEGLDEDEIMEFSDFTDYKNGRNSMSPVWLMVKDQENDKSSAGSVKDNYQDSGSTLSIEQILSPTERSKLARNSSSVSKNGEQPGAKAAKTLTKDDERVTTEHPEGDYSSFSEQEYQDDAPFMYHDLEQNTQVNSPIDEHDMSRTIMREIESALDAVSYGSNFTMDDRQVVLNNASEENVQYSLRNHQIVNETEKKSYEDIVSEVEPEARAEIFELFASGSAGKRLERLLKSRNMSLEELIALRQRGSSKVHLAEVSRLKVQKSNDGHRTEGTAVLELVTLSPAKNVHESQQRSGSFENSTLTPKDFVHPEADTTQQQILTSDSTVQNEGAILDPLSNEAAEEQEDIKGRHRTVQIVDLLTTFGSLPFAKDIQRDFAGDYDIVERRKLPKQDSKVGVAFVNDDAEATRSNDTPSVVQSGYVKEVMKQEPSSIDIRTVYGDTSNPVAEEEDDEKGKTLSKVKPSIIASGAILGVTIVVFLAIFIVCRIRQKQKYRYRNTFSRAVFQGPMLAARKLSNSSSLSTVMINVVATSTTKRPERNEIREPVGDADLKSDIDNDSLDANDSWETIPDYMK